MEMEERTLRAKSSAHIFWDKNDDGERNESIEPAIKTNENGEFAFEWIPPPH